MTAASVVLPLLSDLPNFNAIPTDGKQLRVAFCGLGSYANRVAEAMQSCSNAKVVGVISGTPSKIETWQKKYSIPKENCYSYETFDDLKNNPNIDVVYVTSPNALHHPHTIKVAKAGKHVICEKPMSLSVRDCQEMIDACAQRNRLLSIGYRLHFEPFTKEMIRLGQQRVYGRVLEIDCANGFVWGNGDPGAWRLKKALAGGGALMDMGIYTIQAARYVTGEGPIFVSAREEKTLPALFREVDETIYYRLEFPGGAIAHGRSSYNANWNHLKVRAEKGWFELTEAYRYNGMAGATQQGPMRFDPNLNQQSMQMDDFAACIAEKRRSSVAGEEGLKDMKVVEAIYRSLASGQKERI